jgi:catechol 2,3-dioxygenase-like lactoylglutathione lyase family enzyme
MTRWSRLNGNRPKVLLGEVEGPEQVVLQHLPHAFRHGGVLPPPSGCNAERLEIDSVFPIQQGNASERFHMCQTHFSLRTLALAGVLVAVFSLALQFTAAQGVKNNGYRLSVVGIAVSDYAKSQDFYGKKMGLRVAFKFTSSDGQRTTTYYQLSRDTFLEMAQAGGDVQPGFTHVHLVVDDLNGTIVRLKQAGIAGSARNATTPGTVTETGVAQPSNVRNANVYDPDGRRLELNELIPESLTRKATQSWSDTYPSYRLYVIGIGYKDFAISDDFYEKKLGARTAFFITPPMHPYLQLSRDTFIDFQSTGTNAPSFNHVHLQVDDLPKTLERLKQNGVPAAMPTFSPPSQLYSANVTDPDNLRLELNQWVDSRPKTAAEGWK